MNLTTVSHKMKQNWVITSLIVYVIVLICFKSSNGELKNKYRLPRDILPLSYKLRVQPLIEKNQFWGEVYIDINVTKPVKHIYLHSSDQNITNLRYDDDDFGIVYKLESPFDLMTIFLNNGSHFRTGIHTIFIKYDGILNVNQSTGMIKTSYLSKKNETETTISTYFEPTFARKMFPCFDEPFFKATFNISMILPKNSTHRALSNMPEKPKLILNDTISYEFESTPKMSTYLVAVAVTKLDYSEKVLQFDFGNITMRLFQWSEDKRINDYIFEMSEKALKYMTEYTGIAPVMRKFDMIEFSKQDALATEEWGLITCNLGMLSPYNNVYDNYVRKQVIVHEIVHNWMGNYVTCDWWEDIWFNEGFSDYFSQKIINEVNNDNNTWQWDYKFMYDDYVVGQETTPSIKKVNSYAEIKEIFNMPTYYKGGNVVRMMEFLLKDDLKLFIRALLQKYAFKTVTSENIIELLKEYMPKEQWRNFKEYFETKMYQNQEVVIKISKDETQKKYVLTQNRYRRKDHEYKTEFKYHWTMPVFYKKSNSEPELIWFRYSNNEVTIPYEDDTKWIKLNYNYIAHFKTLYSPEMWEEIINNLSEIPKLEQSHLFYEALNFYYEGYLNCDILIKLMENRVTKGERSNLFKMAHSLKCYPKFYFIVRSLYSGNRTLPTKRKTEDLTNQNLIEPDDDFTQFRNKACEPFPEVLDEQITQKCLKWMYSYFVI